MIRLVVATVLSAYALCACAAADAQVACVDDSGCGDTLVCAFGQCSDPNVGRLGPIDLQIEPGPQAAVPAQALFDVDPDDGARLDLSLRAGVALVGSVTHDGVGVAAQVIARPTQFIAGRALAVTAEADEGGGFIVIGVEDESYRIAITPASPDLPPLYDDRAVRADPGPSGERELPPYALPLEVLSVTGRVVAGEGASLQGIPALDVRLRYTDGEQAGRRASSSARTGADGSFSVVLAAAAVDLVLEVRATTDNAYHPSLDRPVPFLTGDTALGDVELGLVLSPVRFDALVLDDDGQPAEGATVSLSGEVGLGTFGARGVTNAGGRASLDVPPGEYEIVVIGPDRAKAGLRIVRDVAVPVDAGELTVQLPRRARASGAVVDPTLGPVVAAGVAFVRVADEDGEPEPALEGLFIGALASTGEDGEFDVDVPPGRYRVNVTPPLSLVAPPLSTVVTVGENGFSGDLALPARAILAGTVMFDGRPVPDAYVRVFGDVTTESGAALQLGEGLAGPDGRVEIVVAAQPSAE